MEKESKSEANEPQPVYGNRVSITTHAALEERDRGHTRNMTPLQRMEYLQKLISIVFGDDFSAQENFFNEGRVYIKKTE